MTRPTHRALRRLALLLAMPARRRRTRTGGCACASSSTTRRAAATIRTVLNLSAYLAREHDIEIVSVLRRREGTYCPVDPDVRVRYVRDLRRRPRDPDWTLGLDVV